MSVLVKEEISSGVYVYHNNGNTIVEDNLTHILFDVDTMGRLKGYEISEDLKNVYVYLEE